MESDNVLFECVIFVVFARSTMSNEGEGAWYRCVVSGSGPRRGR